MSQCNFYNESDCGLLTCIKCGVTSCIHNFDKQPCIQGYCWVCGKQLDHKGPHETKYTLYRKRDGRWLYWCSDECFERLPEYDYSNKF